MQRYIDDLYNSWVAIEEFDGARIVVRYPPLLDMLASATESHSGDAGGASVSKSRAPLNLGALALRTRIERESHNVAAMVGIDATAQPRSLCARLAAIGDRIDEDDTPATAWPVVRAWWRDARQLLGIDAAPYVPHVRCPNVQCERWSTLRVRLRDP